MVYYALEAGPSGRMSQEQKGPSIAQQKVEQVLQVALRSSHNFACPGLGSICQEARASCEHSGLLTAFTQDLLDVQHARCCLLSWSELSMSAADSSAKQDRRQEGDQRT